MDRKTLVNQDGRQVFVDTPEAEAAFRAKGYAAEGEVAAPPKDDDKGGGKGAGKGAGKGN